MQAVNARDEYVYKIESVVLFGSMLTDMDRLGDVDLAIELQPTALDDRVFQDQCQSRRRLALEERDLGLRSTGQYGRPWRSFCS
jgi:predicted nucleotidyltransferase